MWSKMVQNGKNGSKFLWSCFSIITHFYEVAFPLLHTNHTLGKRGPHSLNRLQAKNSEICTKPLKQWVLWGPFSIITHKSTPWKTGATQFESITSNKIRNLHETSGAMVWGPFSIIKHKSPPWKTGTTQFECIVSQNFRNLHETTEVMSFIRSFLHY